MYGWEMLLGVWGVVRACLQVLLQGLEPCTCVVAFLLI